MKEEELIGKCPYTTAQKALSGKWSLVIMHILSAGPVRFNELHRRLPDMTHATLSRQLKQLEENGLIIRREYSQIPPKVEYELSEIGLKFRPVLRELQNWGLDYIDYMYENKMGNRYRQN